MDASLIVAAIVAWAWPLSADDPQPAADVPVRPTLQEIFKPPRLLGVRPRDPSLSASGRFVLYRWASEDAEKPKLDWWLAAADGSSEPRKLFAADAHVDLQWAPRGDELLLFRNGWIERMDLASDGVARPLFECGENHSRLVFTRDGGRALFVAGDDAQLWVLDLATGGRHSPGHSLSDRGRWFQLLEECDSIALFAAAPNSSTPAADSPPAAAREPTKEGAANVGAVKEPASGTPKKPRVLWFVPLASDGEARATKLEEGDNVQLSADGRYASIARTNSDVKRQLVVADFLTDTVTTVPVRNDLAGDPAAQTSLALYDFERGEKTTPPTDEGNRFIVLDTEWSPSGARLLVHRVSGDFHVRQLLVVDADGKNAWPLFSERDDAWIGGPTLFASWTRDGSAVVFTSEQSGWCQLYSAPAEGGEVRALTQGAFEVQAVHLLEEGTQLLLVTNEQDRAEQVLSRLDLGSGERVTLAAPRGSIDQLVASRAGDRVAFLHEELGVPADLWTLATEPSATAVQLTETVPDALRELKLPPPEIVDYTNASDGTNVRALLYRPEPFEPGRTYPAVVFVHGAGYLQNVTRSMTEYPLNLLFHHRLARLGFFVLDADYRHSAGYGRKFRTDVYGFMGGKDLDDEVAGVDYLKSLGCVDGSRIGVYGGSYGGFMTLMALFTKPDVFACGAALRSVTDWRSYNAWYTNARLGDPKSDAANYARSSPIDHAEGLKKPLLLLHGLKDSNVFAQDTIRLTEKLIQLGKDFDEMLYPSQDHGFTDPESWIDEYRRIERLFVRELKPVASGRGSATSPAPRPPRTRPL